MQLEHHLDKLPDLIRFVENPWFKLFCEELATESEACRMAVFSLATPDIGSLISREQVIGEGRALGRFERLVTESVDALRELVKEKNES
jgi:hypothetical protein